jgi:alpha-L-rhamnosidase
MRAAVGGFASMDARFATPALRTLLSLVVLGTTTSLNAQSINPSLLTSRWTAHWIRPAEAPRRDFGVYHFRTAFALPARPDRFVIHASADNRYQLFVNGVRVLNGPARGDLDHWRFETQDIAPQLRAGRNVLAAVVWNFADDAPMAQMSNETALIVQGDTEREHVVNTGKGWKAQRDRGWALLPVDRPSIFYEYYVGGPGEQVTAAAHEWGWETTEFDDSGWGPVAEITIGGPRAIRDTPSRWMLVPRAIPLMEETPERFARVARVEGAQVPNGFVEGRTGWTIPAATSVRLLLDRGHLTVAYPEITTSRGNGATLSVTYSEALRVPLPDGKKGPKGNRDQVEGKVVTGVRDRFLPDGGARRMFRPLWWRTYRFVEVEITTKGEPLTIDSIQATFTAYPVQQRATFESDDPELTRIWDVGWRTARLCAHETYMDTPYWEQLQYVGDTRIQALLSLYVGGDDRLVKNAIELFHESRIPDGLTQSRYPSRLPQIIPPFSLFWIGMLHDLYSYGGDAEFVRRHLRGADGVLNWFATRLTPSSLLGRLEWWNFVDWVEERGFDFGEPPFDAGGQSAILSLQFALALREAADLERASGTPRRAAEYEDLAGKIIASVRELCWDESRRFFADTPSKKTFSQHVNLLAVLTDLVPPADQQTFMQRVLSEPSLTQTTYYYRFYLFRALKKAGLGSEYLGQLRPWREMLQLGLTTWAEKPEPTRSDSHAWSAHPNYDLLTTVAGVEPATPGFRTVRISPHLGHLRNVRVTVPTPRGPVRVSYQRDGSRLSAEITLPAGVTGTFEWNGRSMPLRSGTQQVEP